jgi:3-oxoacid CoA-transferase
LRFFFTFTSSFLLNQCVFTVDKEEGLTLTEIALDTTLEDVIAATGCEFNVADPLKPMGQI